MKERMHSKLIPTLVLLALFNFSCTQSRENSSDTVEDTKEQPVFEAIDVYRNPNTFEQYAGRLKPGDTPPSMKIEKWFNGTPVNRFEEGKVYVVEFFASWCQPCRKSIPHLNKLQGEFKDQLVVIGLAASESEPNSTRLERLLTAKKDILTYRVAYTSDEKTFKDWNWGARNTGLPWAFIIDKKGKLAWFGQPFQSRFEPVLRAVLNGSYMPASEVQVADENFERRKELWPVQEAFWNAVGSEDWQKSVSLGERLLSSGDQMFYYEAAQVFQIKYEELGMKEEALSLLETLRADLLQGIPEGLSYMARVIGRDTEASGQALDLAFALARETNDLTLYENPGLLFLLGTLHERQGDPQEARQLYEKARQLNDDKELAEELDKKII